MVMFVITISSAITSGIYNYILVKLDIEYLQTIVFILVIAFLVQLVEMVLKNTVKPYIKALEYIFLL